MFPVVGTATFHEDRPEHGPVHVGMRLEPSHSTHVLVDREVLAEWVGQLNELHRLRHICQRFASDLVTG